MKIKQHKHLAVNYYVFLQLRVNIFIVKCLWGKEYTILIVPPPPHP